jgi:hypothetical protein
VADYVPNFLRGEELFFNKAAKLLLGLSFISERLNSQAKSPIGARITHCIFHREAFPFVTLVRLL